MYHPIIKNKLNEMKGISLVNIECNFSPIFELVECKYNDIEKFFKSFTSKINGILQDKAVYIDIPIYLDNELVHEFNLNNLTHKFNFYKSLKKYFDDNGYKMFIPVISFDYSNNPQNQSYKDNLKYAKNMIDHFKIVSFRLCSDATYKNDDLFLINNLTTLLYDKLENVTIIFDYENCKDEKIIQVVSEISMDIKLNQIILVGEAFKSLKRTKTDYLCDRIKNSLIDTFNNVKYRLNIQQNHQIPISYGDFTLVDKIPTSLDIDPEKGFLYYPFIKFTTEDGNLCFFTAKEKGNYEQYSELASSIVSKITNFQQNHCDACKFIYDIATNSNHGLKYKGGGVWKHRMIAHHITTMANVSNL